MSIGITDTKTLAKSPLRPPRSSLSPEFIHWNQALKGYWERVIAVLPVAYFQRWGA